MPELPEVETTARGISPHVCEQTIVDVTIRQHQLRWPIPNHLEHVLLGKKIIKVERRAKYLLLRTNAGSLIIHLGMSGSLRILPIDSVANRHDHVDIAFDNDKILRFNDPRRFGAILWTENDPKHHELLQHLGVEPLGKKFSSKYLWICARGKTVSVKSFLMDSKIVAGIGNIYAAEALFQSGIFPGTQVRLLSLKHFSILVKAIKRILKNAIERGGTTLKDFTDSDGKPGYFSTQLKVYGRSGEPCFSCRTPLKLITIAQRSTVYCRRCQQ